MRGALVVVWVGLVGAAGCADERSYFDHFDLARRNAGDMAVGEGGPPGDLAGADQSVADLSGRDLSVADQGMPDLAMPPPDLAQRPDLAAVPDLSEVPDLLSVPDLLALPD